MFKIISFATNNTPYVKVLENYLIPSLINTKVGYSLDIVDNLGDWTKNTSFKPKFILQKLNELGCDVLFLDADAVIKRDLMPLESLIPHDCLFACHFLQWKEWYGHQEPFRELLSGTLYVRNCQETKEICQEWSDRCTKTSEWEQKILSKLLEEKKIKVFDLPLSYCYITSMPDGTEPKVKCDDVHIQHWQVSRQLRKSARTR